MPPADARRRAVLAAAALACALLAACTASGALAREERGTAASLVGERLGVPLPAVWDDAPSAETLRLLDAGVDDDSAVRIALLEDRALRAAFERLDAASWERVRAGLIANPLFSAAARFGSTGTAIDLALVQPLVDLFGRSLRIDVAGGELAEARAALVEDAARTVADVRDALARFRAQDERVAIARARLVVANEAAELTDLLHAAGNVTDLERTLRARAAARARLELAAEEARAEELREGLVLALGLAEDPGFTVRGGLRAAGEAGIGPAELETRAVESSLALARSAARLESLGALAGFAPTSRTLADAAVGVEAEKDADSSPFGVGPAVTLPLPIFDTGHAAREADRARWRAARYEHETHERALRASARKAARRHAAAAARSREIDAELLPLAARAVVETLQQYNAMQIGAFDVLAERDAELALALAALELREAAELARLDVERLLLGLAPQGAAPKTPTIESGHSVAPTGAHR